MSIDKSGFWTYGIEHHLTTFFNSDIDLGYWNDSKNLYKQGLYISAPKDSALKALKAHVPASFVDGQDVCIGFDDSILFLKKFKKEYLPQFEDKDEFNERYWDFLKSYIKKIKNISLSSKLKPSVIAEEFWGEPIDLLNVENFRKATHCLPKELKKALDKERGLIHYDFAYSSNRFHILKFSLDKVRDKLTERDVLHFDKHYSKYQKNEIKGDALKAAILANIQKEISSVTNNGLEAVHNKYIEIKHRYDYKLLCQSQGMTTLMLGFFGVKTSSAQALDKWMNFTYPDLMESTKPTNKL